MIIKDEVIHPYFITVKDNSFILSITKIKGEDSKSTGDTYDQFIGDYVDLQSLIKKLIKLKLSEEVSVVTLNEFIVKYKNQIDRITNLLN